MKKMTRFSLTMLAAVAMTATVSFAQQAPSAGKPAAENNQYENAVAPAPANAPNSASPAPAGADQPAGDSNRPPMGQRTSPCGFMGGGSEMFMLFGVVALLFVVMFMNSRKQKAQEKQHKEMLAGIKKGDRIVTIGGIIGTAVEVRDDEVVLKVDDEARVKFARWAIRTVGDDAKKQAEKQQAAEKK